VPFSHGSSWAGLCLAEKDRSKIPAPSALRAGSAIPPKQVAMLAGIKQTISLKWDV
jgi:hypothetical protein